MISLQQATGAALADWLTAQLPGVTILPQWPNPDAPFPFKSVTIDLSGSRREIDVQTVQQVLASTNVGTNQANVRFRVAMCEQPVQLDVWAKSDPERDDILARLDIALNAGSRPVPGVYNPAPTADGLLCQLTGDWADSTADFIWTDIDTPDTPDSIRRAEFRATIRGSVMISLAVTKQTARQKTLIFRANLNGGAASTVTTITSTGSTTVL